MPSRALVALIGLICQLSGAGLLALLFLLLRRQARRGRYLLAWTWAWVLLFAALAAISLRYGLSPATASQPASGPERLGVQLLYFFYQWGKLGYGLLLLAGFATFVRGTRLARWVSIGLPALGVYALVTMLSAEGLNRIVFFQGPALALLYVGSAALLAQRLLAEKTFGVSLAFGSLALQAGLSALYSISFLLGGTQVAQPRGLLLVLASYGSYFDLLFQVVLALGMVLIVSEEARRELDAAYAQLEIAYDELRRDSNVDRLTGCFNRRAFEERVGLESMERLFGSIAVVDLDNLKEVNDQLGHEAGDRLLQHLARVLRRQLRPADRIYRLGGDEFAIVLGRARVDEAQARVAGIFRDAPRLLLDGTWPARAELPLQVSLGAAEFHSLEGLSHALRKADRRMYDDKRSRKGLDGVATPGEGISTLHEGAQPTFEPPPEES